MALQVRAVADVHLADQLGVIRHGREVERSRELRVSHRVAVLVEGLDSDPLPLGEAVGVCRTCPRPLGARV